VSLAARRVGRFYLDNTEDEARSNRAYTLVDLAGQVPLPSAWGTGVGLSRLELDVRVNNLLDERYTTFGYVEDGVPLYIPAAGRNLYAGLTFAF
jgi:outer membrane receptor protein involved in Fe transport